MGVRLVDDKFDFPPLVVETHQVKGLWKSRLWAKLGPDHAVVPGYRAGGDGAVGQRGRLLLWPSALGVRCASSTMTSTTLATWSISSAHAAGEPREDLRQHIGYL